MAWKSMGIGAVGVEEYFGHASWGALQAASVEALGCLAVTALGVISGCAASANSPCAVVSDALALAGAPADDRGERLSLVDGPGGAIIATWLHFRQSTPESPGSGIPDSAEIAVLGRDGETRVRDVFAAPSALRTEAVSAHHVGVDWTPKGAVFHWTEGVDVTLAEGPSAKESMKVEFVGADGHEGALYTVTEAECENCELAISSAFFEDAVALVYTKVPGLGPQTPSASSAEGVVTVSPEGMLTATKPLSWLAASGPELGRPPALQLQPSGDDLLLFSGETLWSVDASITPRVGPIRAPGGSGSAVAWAPSSDEAAFAWKGQLTTGVAPDLYFQRKDNTGRPKIEVQRVSTSSGVQATVGDARGYVVLFSADGHDYLAFVDGMGVKVGGDIDLGSSSPLDLATHRLHASTLDRFVDVYSAAGDVRRRELTCAR